MKTKYFLPILLVSVLVSCGSGTNTSVSPNADAIQDALLETDDPVGVDLLAIKAESETEPVIRLDGGILRHALVRLPVEDSDPIKAAFILANKYKNLLGLDNPDEQLYLKKNKKDKDGGEHFFFGIRKNDVSLEGILIGLHKAGSFWTDIQSNIYLGYLEQLKSVDQIDLMTGAAVGKKILSDSDLSNPKITGIPKLVYFNTALFGGVGKIHLAYKIHVQGKNNDGFFDEYFVYADAKTASELGREALNYTSKDFDIESANQTDSDTCWFFAWESRSYWFNQNGPSGYPGLASDMFGDGQTMFDASHEVYDFFFDTFGQRSWNGEDDNVWSMVHVGPGYNNASYIPGCGVMKFGDGYGTLDIAAHEFTHAVTRFAADLVYLNESGALNESFSDVFAYFIDRDDEIIGDELPGGALRSMENPPAFGQPDHMSNLCTMTNDYCAFAADSGGVHTNSGIINKAAWLLLNGGTHNSVHVFAMDRSRVIKLWYDTLQNRISSNAQLLDARDAFVAQVQSYVDGSLFGYARQDVCKVRNAFFSVGLGTADIDCDGREDTADTDDDGDFIADSVDNCATMANPGQADLDADGLGNACDRDQDGDGIWEDGDSSLSETDNRCTAGQVFGCDDNCPTVVNADQLDTDGDQRGDLCDDEDSDGIYNNDDNCPDNYNPLQNDQDDDGLGDVCDTDRDGDGFGNEEDNCPDRVNNSQLDSDADGHGNGCDNCVGTPNPEQTNTDGDGQGDACDNDDDGDSIADADDSCPLDFDPREIDIDNNGVSLVCDEEENAMLDGFDAAGLIGQLDFLNEMDVIRIQIQPCLTDGCPDSLPAGSRFTVNLQINPQVAGQFPYGQMRLVDDQGIVVGRSFAENGQMSIAAPISSDTYFVPPQGNAGAFRGTSYFLEIAPFSANKGGVSVPAGLQVSTDGF